ncbi:putative ABC transport system permease protein [Kribbella orskensis]|uniref:ABC transport system permease protein n=1 Tax=Kribbella orskensis TaxID=2512216 RepID=A0ABY2BDU9_9ACTN|nr:MULTISPECIES: FtsX-like permease family protein [Kribbella]TCN35758.1 putative ABC transport system permease protein [Kribbella sp. VKM Ac-2500]TCO17365.1 putative ABC transport system permease protein [Kribbella orskensis]
MFFLSRQTVHRHRSLYAGSFVALAVGVFLLGLAATATAATVAYDGPAAASITVDLPQADPPQQVRVPLSGADVSGLQVVLSLVAVISGFITIFVIASTFAFAVASRRREVGLLRLIGATPRQVRRMVLGEALVVALAAAVTGAVLAQLATPLLLAKASYTELAPVKLEPASPWVPLLIAISAGLVVAMLGARSAARRAAKVGPVDALREAELEPTRIGVVRIGFGLLFLAGSVVLLALIRPGTGEAVIPLSMFTPMLLVIALTLLAPLVVPWISRLWALPLVAWTRVSGRLARSNVVAAPRRSASLAAPILAISAIAGSMVLTLSFAADAAAATIRDTLRAPIVVTAPEHGAAVRERILGTTGVAAADGAIPIDLIRTDGDSAEVETAEGIDLVAATRTRALSPISGDLADLTGKTVAISKELSGFEGYGVGDEITVTYLDRTADRLRVVAILPAAPGVTASMVLPPELARQHAPEATPSQWFILPAEGVDSGALVTALNERLTGTGASAVPAVEWEEAQGDGLRRGNQFGLILLLGPAALYSAIAIANTLLMGSLQRRHEFVTSRLLGATPAQIRRMVLWESSLVGAVALSLGTAITVTVGVLIRRAMTDGMSDVPATVPWTVLLGIAGLCLILAIGAALAPTAFILRRSHPGAAME